MLRRMSLIALMCTLAAAGTAGTAGTARAEAPAPMELLKRAADTRRALHSYYLSGLKTVDSEHQGTSNHVQSPIILAGSGAREKVELTGGVFEGTRVTDGDSSWIYVAQLEQFRASRAKSDSMPSPNSIDVAVATIFNTIQSELRDVDQNALSAIYASDETLSVSGGKRPCRVLEVNYIPGPDSNKVMSEPRKLWVDAASGLVLKTEVHRRLIALPPGQDMSWTEVTAFDRVNLDPTQPDTAFRFQVKAGTRRVRDFEPPSQHTKTPDGTSARDFTLQDVKGGSHQLSAQKGKVVLLDFWATWCGPCRMELPSIARLAGELGKKGLVVWGINVNEPKERVQNFLTTNSYTFPVLLDAGGSVSAMYGANAIPTVVVVNKKGIVSDYFVGVQSEDALRAALKKAGME
jgi:peroxiredoxin